MESEDDLLCLLLKSANSKSIQTIAEQLENDHNFSFSKDRNDLQGVWSLGGGILKVLFKNIFLLLIIFKFLIPLI